MVTSGASRDAPPQDDGQAVVGSLQQLARYPVKSLRGQRCERVAMTARGLDLDRALAIYGRDGKIASGKTTRRFRRMPNLFALRSWADGTAVWVEMPDGDIFPSDDPTGWAAISRVVGEPVEIRPEDSTTHKDDAAVHLVTTSSLRWAAALQPGFDQAPERYRPNLVIDTAGADRVEDDWIGRRLKVGDCILRVTHATERCVMPTLAQGDLPFLPGLLVALADASAACLGVYAEVESAGEMALGDGVAVLT